MFRLFKAARYQDAVIGELLRSGASWKGNISLPLHGTVPLHIAGGFREPKPAFLALARELPERFSAIAPQIQMGLFEHYEPYRGAAESGEVMDGLESVPTLNSPDDVWPLVSPVRVLIDFLGGIPTVEIAYKVAWDEEHTLGARFQNWQFLELCGSVR